MLKLTTKESQKISLELIQDMSKFQYEVTINVVTVTSLGTDNTFFWSLLLRLLLFFKALFEHSSQMSS